MKVLFTTSLILGALLLVGSSQPAQAVEYQMGAPKYQYSNLENARWRFYFGGPRYWAPQPYVVQPYVVPQPYVHPYYQPYYWGHPGCYWTYDHWGNYVRVCPGY